MKQNSQIDLSAWRLISGSRMVHKATGMVFYLLQGERPDETIIEVDRMAHKPARDEMARLKQEVLYAFERIEMTEER